MGTLISKKKDAGKMSATNSIILSNNSGKKMVIDLDKPMTVLSKEEVEKNRSKAYDYAVGVNL